MAAGYRTVVLTRGEHSTYQVEDVFLVPDGVDLAARWREFCRAFPVSADVLARADAALTRPMFGRRTYTPADMSEEVERQRRLEAHGAWRAWIEAIPGVRRLQHEEFNI